MNAFRLFRPIKKKGSANEKQRHNDQKKQAFFMRLILKKGRHRTFSWIGLYGVNKERLDHGRQHILQTSMMFIGNLPKGDIQPTRIGAAQQNRIHVQEQEIFQHQGKISVSTKPLTTQKPSC